MSVLSRIPVLLVVLLTTAASAASKKTLVEVRFAGKPLSGFTVEYFDGERTVTTATNRQGVALFHLREELSPWRLSSVSEDYVLRNVNDVGTGWQVEAVRSARWRQRDRPRPCDAWRLIMDIPRGSLADESAEEYDEWYSSLGKQDIDNCVALAALEEQVGSKAPWYLYELKGLPPSCVNGVYGPELDWVAWYRRLLEEATKAAPGKCIADWERWWTAKGYHPVPERASMAQY